MRRFGISFAPTLQDKDAQEFSIEEDGPKAFLSSTQEKVLLLFTGLLTFFPPLFYVWVWPNGYDHEFTELRILNAELKFAAFLLFGSPLVGLFLVFIHFRRHVHAFDRSLLVCLGLFLAGVVLSTATAHNPVRACVAALKWHLLPLLLAFTLAHVSWNRLKLVLFLGTALATAGISSWIALDQHYGFTEWGPGLPRYPLDDLGALLFNRNIAAEYHAPFLPLVLGLLLFIRSWPTRIVLSSLLLFVFLPALTLSLARGAWVGLMVGTIVTGLAALFLILRSKDKLGKSFRPSVLVASAFLLLALALPLYVYTTPFWQKSDESGQPINPDVVSTRFESIIPETGKQGRVTGASIHRRLILWQDALEGALSSSPLLGLGSDHYELFFHQSAKRSDDPPIPRTLVRYVHNDYLQTLFENGLLGLFGFLGLWAFVLWRGLQSALACAQGGDHPGFSLRLGLLAAALVFLVTMFFEFPARMPATIVTGWSVLGLLLALSRQTSPEGKPRSVTLGPKVALTVGVVGLLLVPGGLWLAKNVFFADLYHQQGITAANTGKIDKSLRFHRESIARAPWQYRSRTWECFLLLEHLKRYPEAIRSAEQTLAVHPGCLDAHRYRISLLSKYLDRRPDALSAFAELEKAAPYHPVVEKERRKFPELK